MSDAHALLERLSTLNATASFNRWIGLEVVASQAGAVTLAMPWRDELGQYAGFLHAGLIAGLIDTACGFAAATLAGNDVLASHFSVNCLAPAIGETFTVVGTVVKPGRRQFFTRAELFAVKGGEQRLVATGEAILIPLKVES